MKSANLKCITCINLKSGIVATDNLGSVLLPVIVMFMFVVKMSTRMNLVV